MQRTVTDASGQRTATLKGRTIRTTAPEGNNAFTFHTQADANAAWLAFAAK